MVKYSFLSYYVGNMMGRVINMKVPVIKYIILDKDGQEFRPIEHNTEAMPRRGDKFKDVSGTFIVEDVIHEGIFETSGMHTVTIVLKEI